MRKFEGIINGKCYTDESEFRKAISKLDLEDNIDTYVSYRYVSVVDDAKCDSKSIESNINKECNNIVSENEYVKHVVDNSGLDVELIEKLKRASNKSDISINVSKRIEDFDKKISDNLIFINELKNNYKKRSFTSLSPGRGTARSKAESWWWVVPLTNNHLFDKTIQKPLKTNLLFNT